MSKWILAILISLAPIVTQAQWFWGSPNVTYNHVQVQASVYNHWGQTIYCRGQVSGYTYYGHHLFAYMDTIIYPGHWGYVYVYTNYSNPFVNAGGNINCTFY